MGCHIMNKPQMYAVEIEHIMSKVFGCDRFGIGGIVNSDCIRQNPYFSMVSALTYLYASADIKQREIITKFIEDNYFYSKWNLDTILEFDTDTKVIDGCEYTLDYTNGVEAIESIIKNFRSICK